MATERQIKANQKNGKKSTGPRTQEGKNRAKMNALKLGLFAKEALLPGEDPKLLARLHRKLIDRYKPQAVGEFLLIDEIAGVMWRLLRCSKVESGLYHMYRWHDGNPGNEAQAFANDLKNLAAIPKLPSIEGHLDRKLDRLLKRIENLQSRRI